MVLNKTPVLSAEAIEAIKSFYVDTRSEFVNKRDYSRIISSKDLKKIKESAESIAEKRNSKIVSKEDAMKAINQIKIK